MKIRILLGFELEVFMVYGDKEFFYILFILQLDLYRVKCKYDVIINVIEEIIW